VKQSPELEDIQRKMQPGRISLNGFLGSDRRPLAEILDHDHNRVRKLRLTHQEIADRLKFFMKKARRGLGTPVTVEDDFVVRAEEWRGGMPCPWPHPGLYRKGIITLQKLSTGEKLQWTPLNVHMIREHGFYEGRRSDCRLDPEHVARVLNLRTPDKL